MKKKKSIPYLFQCVGFNYYLQFSPLWVCFVDEDIDLRGGEIVLRIFVMYE